MAVLKYNISYTMGIFLILSFVFYASCIQSSEIREKRSKDMLSCDNGKKVPLSYKCDGDNDCGNNYDEKYCRLNKKYKNQYHTNDEIKKATSLKGGETRFEGNVYLFAKPVCDDSWDENDAKVVCHSLGFSSKTIAIATKESHFGKVPDNFILDDVDCKGHEDHLGACHDYITIDNCGEGEGAGVKCIDPYSIQLRGGQSRYEGNVYISQKPVCDDDWDNYDAKVICRSLGFSSKTIAISTKESHFGKVSDNFILDNVDCKGNEYNTGSCSYSTNENCDNSEAAGVKCIDPYAIQLKGGQTTYEGNVYISEKPVCDDHWDNNDAKVVCRSLGFPSYVMAVATIRSLYGKVCNDFILDNVDCKGNEYNIGSCSYSTNENCGGGEAAGVKCIDPYAIQLKGGKDRNEGNVYLSGKPVCDDHWDDNAAKVVCRSLGFSSNGLFVATLKSHFGRVGDDDFILDDFRCTGDEDNLGKCAYSTIENCGGGEAAGVKCSGPKLF